LAWYHWTYPLHIFHISRSGKLPFFIGKSWYIIMLIRVSHRSSYHSYGSEKYHINHFVSSSMGGQIAKRIQPFSRCLQRLNLVAWRGAMARRTLGGKTSAWTTTWPIARCQASWSEEMNRVVSSYIDV
jgi:hypothetical protein